MKKLITTNVLIIGAGAAGIYCATSLNYFDIDNCIVEINDYIGGQPIQLYPNKQVYDFPGQVNIVSQDIIYSLLEQLKSYNKTQIFTSTFIQSIDKLENGFLVETKTKKIECNYIVVATGIGAFVPNKIEINNKVYESSKVQYTVDNDISKYLNKKIVVLGGGDSAVDWANFFVENKISNDVSIVHRRQEYRSIGVSVEKLTKNKVNQYKNFEILDINDNTIKIKDNASHNQISLDYDYIIVQYGQKPNILSNGVFSQLKRNERKHIITDKNQKTNIKNMFAIGGCALYDGKPNTILNACADGMSVAWYLARAKNREW